MTTIAYNHKDKQVAIDSRVTEGQMIVSDLVDKSFIKHGRLFLLSGIPACFDCFVDHVVNNTEPERCLNVGGFMIHNGKIKIVGYDEDYGIYVEPVNENRAVGSGKEYAITAMDYGATAKEAVIYAMTRDIYSGGNIQSFDVRDM